MSSRPARSEASTPRLLVLDDGQPLEVFDVLGLTEGIARVRSPYLFEVGEELAVRLEADGGASEAVARVRAHVGRGDAQVTELELTELTEPTAAAGPVELPAAAAAAPAAEPAGG